MKQPIVSVIIPTYNYSKYIETAVKSVLVQNYPKEKIEIIVIDDGSTDNTGEVVSPFIENDGVVYVHQKNQGKASATQRGIQLARGEYVFNLDADDFFLPEKIQKFVSIFEANPDVVHVSSPAKCVYESTKEWYTEAVPTSLLELALDGHDVLDFFYSNKILFGGGSTFAARASALTRTPIPSAVDMYTDEFLIIATLSQGKTFFLPEALSVWRIHASNYSGKSMLQKQIEKNSRLVNSSKGMLEAIRYLPISESLKRIYELQHLVRVLNFKEEANEKTLGDIWMFFVYLVRSRIPVKIVRKHAAMNRLIPTGLIRFYKALMK